MERRTRGKRREGVREKEGGKVRELQTLINCVQVIQTLRLASIKVMRLLRRESEEDVKVDNERCV